MESYVDAVPSVEAMELKRNKKLLYMFKLVDLPRLDVNNKDKVIDVVARVEFTKNEEMK